MMSGKTSFLVFFSLVAFFLLLLHHVNAEDEDQPRKNANMAPFESWRSAYFCLMNTTKPCMSKHGYQLKLNGAIIVQDSDIKDFCDNGCYEQTKNVLSCIKDVKSDFYFATKQPVSYVWNVTTDACASKNKGFNTNVTKPAT